MEIEKKYLLEFIPFGLDRFPILRIRQTYLSTSPTIRLRQQNDDYILTVKGEGLMVRDEFELPLTQEQFHRLSQKTETTFLEKCRYQIPLENGLLAELDVYKGELEGLLTVEVEFTSEAQAMAFVPPTWFGREVTMDKRYKNSSLSQLGLPLA